VIGVFIFIMFLIEVNNIHTANMIGNTHTKERDDTCGIEGGTALTSFRNTANTERPITGARKAHNSPRISTHLMMAE
jgi:hypothetical protein